MSMDEYKQLEAGDIALVKTNSFMGRLIGKAFRCPSKLPWHGDSTPSGHNGIVGVNSKMELCIFEAVPSGFRARPITDYIADVHNEKCEIIFARFKVPLTNLQKSKSQWWLQIHLGTKYDYLSYISHIWRIVLRQVPIVKIQSKSKFWCTEALQKWSQSVGQTVLLGIDMIAPIHIEQAIDSEEMVIVAHYY